MVEQIDRFISERIVAAGKLIAILAVDKIRPAGDVILTFGRLSRRRHPRCFATNLWPLF